MVLFSELAVNNSNPRLASKAGVALEKKSSELCLNMKDSGRSLKTPLSSRDTE